VVGTAFSASIRGAALLCSERQVPMVSPGATSVALTNKDQYPFFSRSIGSAGAHYKMGVAFIYDMGWRRVALLTSNEEIGSAVSRQILLPGLAASNINFLHLQYEEPVNSTGAPISKNIAKLEAQLKILHSAAYMIIFHACLQRFALSVVAAAVSVSPDFTKKVWIAEQSGVFDLFPRFPQTVGFIPFLGAKTTEQIDFEARWRTVATIWNESRDGGYDPLTKAPFFDNATIGNAKIWDTNNKPVGNGLPDWWAMFVYDTVWLFL
jgi:hypothetical protein